MYKHFTWKTTATWRKNGLFQGSFSLMLCFYWCICSVDRKTEPGVTGMRDERGRLRDWYEPEILWVIYTPIINRKKMGRGTMKRRVAAHAHSYLICHLSCCCISSCHCCDLVASLQSLLQHWGALLGLLCCQGQQLHHNPVGHGGGLYLGYGNIISFTHDRVYCKCRGLQ